MIEPTDYLTRPYYDQWLQTYAAMLINSGTATAAEIAAGKAAMPAPGLAPPMAPSDVGAATRAVARFDREYAGTPAFVPQDAVRAKAHGTPGHTRLPAYVRGRRGWIATYHGAHILPDANALGEARAEPLYTVVFEGSELWGASADSRDRVFVDLWEIYLAPA